MDNKMLRIVAYTEAEGGTWHRCINILGRYEDFVDEEELLFALASCNRTGDTKAYVHWALPEVHSLRFEHGHEWDCVNGWRLSPLIDIELLADTVLYRELEAEGYAKANAEWNGILEYASWSITYTSEYLRG